MIFEDVLRALLAVDGIIMWGKIIEEQGLLILINYRQSDSQNLNYMWTEIGRCDLIG